MPGPGDEGIHAGGLADVQGVEMGFGRTSLAGGRGDVFEAINATGAEQEVGAFGAECAGGSGAEAAGGASDEDPFILQCHCIHRLHLFISFSPGTALA